MRKADLETLVRLHTNLNTFGAVVALLEGGTVYGTVGSEKCAKKVIDLCKQEMNRLVVRHDDLRAMLAAAPTQQQEIKQDATAARLISENGVGLKQAQERSATENARKTAEIFNRVCKDCMGRGAYDDPPWAIVQCPACNGTGRKESALALATPSPGKAEAERDAADAARYRYLRDEHELSVRDVFSSWCKELNAGLDAAIDVAIQQGRSE